MLRITRVADSAAQAPAHVLRLDYDRRSRSRLAAVCEDGTAVAVILPRGTVLRDGMQLVADSGERVVVEAAAQPLTRVTAGDPLQLLRCVYHLANRHVKAQLAADAVLIERDPVLEQMLRALGGHCETVDAPFEPEAGAYHGHGGHHTHAEAIDPVSATVGEQLSIEAHRAGHGAR